MTAPIRLTVVLSHPVQYFAPWFRHITAHCPQIDLTVLYGAIPDPVQQGIGFARAFSWDVPVTEGYRHVVCRESAGHRFDSDHFFGLDVPDIEARIAHTRPDVVLVPGWHSVMQVRALRACRRLGVPVLYRGDSTLRSGSRRFVRPLWRLKTRMMLRKFDGYLAVGTGAREYFVDFRVPEPLVFQSPHCADHDRFAAASDAVRASEERQRRRAEIGAAPADFVVCFAGKFVERKQPLAAVRAAAGLGPSAVLMMAGDGPLAAEAQAEAARLGVRLAWRGFVNQAELPATFATADCLLVPSTWESWGLVVNEALASGLPCVVTRGVEAARDLIVDGRTGYAVPVGDERAMTARLRDVAAALARHHDFAPACRAQIRDHGFDAATAGLLAACRRVVLRRQSPAIAPEAPRVVALCADMVSVFGRERMTFEVLRALREGGAAVHCVVNWWEGSRNVAMAEEIGATWSAGAYSHEFARRGWTPGGAVRLAYDVARVSIELLRHVRRLRATHVFAPGYVPVLHTWPALVLLRAMGVRVILRLGNAPDADRFYARLWRRVISPVVDLFVANSQFTARALAATGVPARKIRTIYNTAPRRVPQGGAPQPKDWRRIIYVGQMIPPKGVAVLLDAVGILVSKGIDVSLDAVGDIDGWEPRGWEGYRARLRARAGEADLRGRVTFRGIRDDIPARLAAAAIHCCPSLPELREGFGLVTIEAKEAGSRLS